jgi:anti-sigma B factor antagonist
MADQGHPVAGTAADAAVILPAEIDITNASQVGQELIAAIQPGVTVLIADMTGTVFCDCSGMTALARVHQVAAGKGAELRLVITARAVLRVFTLNGADQVFKIYPSLPIARAEAH